MVKQLLIILIGSASVQMVTGSGFPRRQLPAGGWDQLMATTRSARRGGQSGVRSQESGVRSQDTCGARSPGVRTPGGRDNLERGVRRDGTTDSSQCHCLTSFKVKIQLDHYRIGDGSYVDVHKFI